MLRLILAWLICFVPLAGAQAAGYDDYSQGLAAKNRGDVDLALAKFTAAINDGDLNAELVPMAYLNRGRMRRSKDACADALEDFNAVLKLKPDDLDALGARTDAYICLSKFDQAIADYSAVVAANPSAASFGARGQIYWLAGNFAAAAQDFQRDVELDPKYVYSRIWLNVMRVRMGSANAAQIDQDAHDLDLSEWPLPIFHLFAGHSTPDDVMTATAKDDGDETLEGRQCEARFYSAEWWLAQNRVDAAKPLLEQASKNCPQGFVEGGLAKLELKRLN